MKWACVPNLTLAAGEDGQEPGPGSLPQLTPSSCSSNLVAASQLEHKAREASSPNHLGHFLKNWFLLTVFHKEQK